MFQYLDDITCSGQSSFSWLGGHPEWEARPHQWWIDYHPEAVAQQDDRFGHTALKNLAHTENHHLRKDLYRYIYLKWVANFRSLDHLIKTQYISQAALTLRHMEWLCAYHCCWEVRQVVLTKHYSSMPDYRGRNLAVSCKTRGNLGSFLTHGG